MLSWIAMFGGQHMELAALTTSDNLAERSGRTGALVQAGAANLGKRTLFWNHHTSPEGDVRTRRQLVSWHQVLEKAHQENVKSSESNTESMSLKDRCTVQQETFKFCFLVLQLTILVSVRYIRAGNFPLYIQSLPELLHWFFTFGHYHYVRWTSVHVVIWWFRLICIPTYMQNSRRDTSPSRRRRFQTWPSIKHVRNIILLLRIMMDCWHHWVSRSLANVDQGWHVSLMTPKDETIVHCVHLTWATTSNGQECRIYYCKRWCQ